MRTRSWQSDSQMRSGSFLSFRVTSENVFRLMISNVRRLPVKLE